MIKEIFVLNAETKKITACNVTKIDLAGAWIYFKYNGKERQFYIKGASRIKPLATSMECDDYNYLVSTNSADLSNIREFVNSKMHKLSQKIETILK